MSEDEFPSIDVYICTYSGGLCACVPPPPLGAVMQGALSSCERGLLPIGCLPLSPHTLTPCALGCLPPLIVQSLLKSWSPLAWPPST
jgi:hypothetical protein